MDNKFVGEFDVATLYAVIVNSDNTEGRGSDTLYCYCETYDDANIISYGKDVMGSKGKIQLVAVLIDEDGMYFTLNKLNTHLSSIEITKPSEDELHKAKEKSCQNQMHNIKHKLSIQEINFLKQNKHLI